MSGGSRGIGAATVRRLAGDGWDVGFCYHGDGPSAREVEKTAAERGVRVVGTDVDVTDAAEVTSWFRMTEDELCPVDAVVTCAGITREQPLALLEEGVVPGGEHHDHRELHPEHAVDDRSNPPPPGRRLLVG